MIKHIAPSCNNQNSRFSVLLAIIALALLTSAMAGCATPEPEPEPIPYERPQKPENIADKRVIPEVIAPDPLTIAFPYQRAKLLSAATQAIDELLSSTEYPDKLIYNVDGYTCNQGDPDYNKLLSLWRAELVRDYLISKGIDEDSITVTGHGKANPARSNRTQAGRVKNRRVVITPLVP